MLGSRSFTIILVLLALMNWACARESRDDSKRTIRFSGYQWQVRPSEKTKSNPGPNHYSSSEKNVWVDQKGRLHLRIAKRGGKWYCSEVAAINSLGYGKYVFQISGRPDKLDKNIVVGLFIYAHGSEYFHREIDIEFARWGHSAKDNAYYTVQPLSEPENSKSFNVDLAGGKSTHIFEWNPDSVSFQSLSGFSLSPVSQESVLKSWKYEGDDVPPAGKEKTLIDFWLSDGKPPSDGKAAEIVIESFKFIKK
jgi:hypothetical protein